MRREVFQAAIAVAASLFASAIPANQLFGQALTAVQTGAGNSTIRLNPIVGLTFNNGTANVAATPIDAATIPGDSKLYIGTYDPTNPQVMVVDPYAKTQAASPFLKFSDFGTQTLVTGQGMQGMTFSPNYNDPTKPGYHKFYTYTSEKSPGAGSIMFLHPEVPTPSTTAASVAVLREWTANAAGTAIDTSVSSRVVFNFYTPATHMGGGLKFGKDGLLYLSTGDGGKSGDGYSGNILSNNDGFTGRDNSGTLTDVPAISNGQDFTNPLGKVIRIDPYVTNGNGSLRSTPADEVGKSYFGADASHPSYYVPNSNPWAVIDANTPYFSPTGPVPNTTPLPPMPELYAIGFRNPWKLSFDKNAGPNAGPYVADVGSHTREEIDVIEKGKDYGWPFREGDVASATALSSGSLTRPTGPMPFYKLAGGTFSAYNLDPTLTDTTQMHGPIARLGTRGGTGSGTGPTGTFTFSDKPGNNIFNDFSDPPTNSQPIYGNAYGDTSAVAGGYIYRGSAIPELFGKYVFGGYEYLVDDPTRLASYGAMPSGGRLYYFDPNENVTYKTVKQFNIDSTGVTIPLSSSGELMGFAEADNGELFAMLTGGSILKINPSPAWKTDADGVWSGTTNWSGTVPDATNAATYFGPAISAPRVVTVDGGKIVGALNFDSPISYTLGGSTISLDVFGDVGIKAAVNVVDGSHTISAPLKLDSDTLFNIDQPTSSLLVTGTLNATGRAITKNGLGLAQFESLRAGTLTVNQGTVVIRARGTPNVQAGVSRVSSLSIAVGAKLDLADNAMVLDYTSVGTLVSDVRQHLLAGRISSSSADSTHRIGYADNSLLHLTNFEGQSVTDNAVLLKFTYSGDSDLDGDVDASDLGRLASHWQQSAVWTGGDLNYDGTVDINDLYLLASTWQLGVGSPLPGSSFGEALASLGLPNVPEPASLGLIGVAAAALLTRRRIRH